MTNSRALGTENIKKLIWQLGTPAMLAQLINMLYNIVDRIYLGRLEGMGSYALSGIGISGPVIILITAFASMIGGGGAPLAAISLGSGDKEHANDIMQVCFSLAIIMSFLLSILSYTFKKNLLFMFGASENSYPYADEYLSYYLTGMLFAMLGTGLNGFISAQGKANIAMIAISLGAITNIILDPIFIFTLGMGIKGAAIASAISQAVSAIFILKFLCSPKSELVLKIKLFIDFKVMKRIIMLGMSYFVMQSTESAIAIVFNRQLLVYGSDVHIAAMAIMQSIIMIVTVPLGGFNSGVQALISYNYGANNPDRIKETIVHLLKLSLSIQTAYCLSVIFFPRLFAQIFTKDIPTLDIVEQFMPIFVSGIWIFAIQNVAQTFFVATNKPATSLFVAILRKIVILIPLALILPKFFDIVGIYAAETIADHISATVSGLLLLYYYKRLD